jgi:hypothetical protein
MKVHSQRSEPQMKIPKILFLFSSKLPTTRQGVYFLKKAIETYVISLRSLIKLRKLPVLILLETISNIFYERGNPNSSLKA